MEPLPEIIFASLIPNAGLLGMLLAFYRRKQPASFRGAMLWLVLAVGATGLMLSFWLVGRTRSIPFREPIIFASQCLFAFVYPAAAFYWIRFQAGGASGRSDLTKALGMLFLILIGILWLYLVVLMSIEVARSVPNFF